MENIPIKIVHRRRTKITEFITVFHIGQEVSVFYTKSEKKATKTVEAEAAKVANTPYAKLKKDGTPDKKYKANKMLKKDGTPDKRYKANK